MLQTQFVSCAAGHRVVVAQVQIVLEQQRPHLIAEAQEQLQSRCIARHLLHGVEGVEALGRDIAIQRLECIDGPGEPAFQQLQPEDLPGGIHGNPLPGIGRLTVLARSLEPGPGVGPLMQMEQDEVALFFHQ
ncbi:hypothetical protein D3C78_1629470 [compost metagenome]